MLDREIFISEFWKRIASVSGVSYSARNPVKPPNVGNLPAVQFFEMDDIVESQSQRGAYQIYKRKLTIVTEVYIKATSEPSATKELASLVSSVKTSIYEGGNNLNNTCSEIQESSYSRILRPPAGENVIGVGLIFYIRYIENIGNLF